MRRAWLASTLAVAAAAAAVAGCGGEGVEPAALHPAPATAATASHSAKPQPRPRHLLLLPRRGHAIVYVRPHMTVSLRTKPGGRRVRSVGARTPYGSRTALSVVVHRGRWAGVATPYLPNGRLAWVRLDRRRLAAGSTRSAIAIDLATWRGSLLRGRHVVRRFAVTVGAPGSPTPSGRFAVTDTFRGGLNPAYGCCALALSARQPNLPAGWLGGDRIAIHGTYGPVGYAESHGCIRVTNADADALVSSVPVGAPVYIRG